MKNLRYSPKASIDGPWLLSSKSLRELDTIINEYWEKFESRREKHLRRAVKDFKKKFSKPEKQLAQISEDYRKELDNRIREHKERLVWSKSGRFFEIDLSDNTVHSYQNFEDAYRDRYLLDKRLTGFHMTLLSGNIEFDMAVDSSGMNFRIEPPKDVPEVQEIYTTVYEWAMEIRRRSRLQGIWGKVAKQRWKILLIGVAIGLLLPLLFPLANQITYTRDIEKELFGLYEKGITSTNVVDAVNLLVLLRRGEPVISPQANHRLIAYWGSFVYLVLLSFISPKVELDIGRGRDAIHRWRLWQWVVLAPIVFLVGDVLQPYLAELVKNFLFLIR